MKYDIQEENGFPASSPASSPATYSVAAGAPPNGALPRPAFLFCSCAALWASRFGPFLLELFEASVSRLLPKDCQWTNQDQHSHYTSANHADDQHERPARNQPEREHDVSNNFVDPELRKFPIERLEPALI